MIKEKAEAVQMWKTGYKKEKPKSEKKKRKCMVCATEFISTWNGNRVCKLCKSNDLWKSGPNCAVQSLNLSDLGSQTPKNLPSSFNNKKLAPNEDEKYASWLAVRCMPNP